MTTATNHAGVSVTESDGSTEVTEGGGTDSYTVVLESQPSADVTIAVAADGQITADTDALTFTPQNWDTPQTVTVAAADDATVEAPHEGTVTHTATSTDQAYDGIAVADVTVSVTDNDLAAELEGPLTAVDEAAETMTVMGTTVDVSNATFHTPTDQISFSEVTGEPLPGRGTTPGFVGGTTIAVGSTAEGGGAVVADEVTVTVAENVIVGTVTENTIPEGGSLADGTFALQGTAVNPIRDDRYTPTVVAEGTDMSVDPATVPVGSSASAEGYLAQDGTFYVHTVEVTSGDLQNSETTISRARCDGKLEIRGTSSTAPEAVTFFDETGAELGRVSVAEDPEAATNGFRFRRDVDELPGGSCPQRIRAENTNGSSTTVDL